MADDQKSSRTQITVALIGVLGALLVAIISNSDKIFPPSGPPKFVPSAAEDKRTETTALPARQGTIPQSKSGPAIAVKEPPKPTSLSSPQPTAPLCGSTIPIDRPLIFAWARVNGASTYSVEVDCFGLHREKLVQRWWVPMACSRGSGPSDSNLQLEPAGSAPPGRWTRRPLESMGG